MRVVSHDLWHFRTCLKCSFEWCSAMRAEPDCIRDGATLLVAESDL
jgi:hypothetical protein